MSITKPHPDTQPAKFALAADLAGVLGDVWRRKGGIVFFGLIALALGLMTSLSIKSRYMAVAEIAVETDTPGKPGPRSRDYVHDTASIGLSRPAAGVTPPVTANTAFAADHVAGVRALQITMRVIRRLGLGDLHEFNENSESRSYMERMLVAIGVRADTAMMPLEHRLLENYYERLSVRAEADTGIIHVGFWSQNPVLSAKIANMIADEYIAQQRAEHDETIKALSAEQNALLKRIGAMDKIIAGHTDQTGSYYAGTTGVVTNRRNHASALQLLKREAKVQRDLLNKTQKRLDVARRASDATPALVRLNRRAVAAGFPIFPDRQLISTAFVLTALLLATCWIILRASAFHYRQRVEQRAIATYRATIATSMAAGPGATPDPLLPCAAPRAHAGDAPAAGNVKGNAAGDDILDTPVSTPAPQMSAQSFADRMKADLADVEVAPVAHQARALPAGAANRVDDVKAREAKAREAKAQEVETQDADAQEANIIYSTDNHADLWDFVEGNVRRRLNGKCLAVTGTLSALDIAANAAAFARYCASAQRRVILVDANATQPHMDTLCSPHGHDGLSDLLAGDVTFADVIQRDGTSFVHVIAFGRQSADIRYPDIRRRFELILAALSNTYDVLILNLGNECEHPYYQNLIALTDATIIAAGRDDETRVDTLIGRLETFDRRGPTVQLTALQGVEARHAVA